MRELNSFRVGRVTTCLLCLVLFVVATTGATTTRSSALNLGDDAPVNYALARVEAAVASPKLADEVADRVTLADLMPPAATAANATNSVEAGSTVSKINITESGLGHVFDRHLADGALSAGKSTFYDNVTITRLIADADAVAPITQANGNLAYTVNAGRSIGIDRATNAATSTYTVITRPSGELVTAFPGMP